MTTSSAAAKTTRVFSGIQPTGDMHVGNYGDPGRREVRAAMGLGSGAT